MILFNYVDILFNAKCENDFPNIPMKWEGNELQYNAK